MKSRKNLIIGSLSCAAMFVIILDGKTAIISIQSGVDLCLRTVIPALFPFFVLSKLLNSCFLGLSFIFMRPLQQLCKIPRGAESILLIGLVSGYPVGAQLVSDAYSDGSLTQEDAKRMLGFCSNAGPAFIFGILSTAFANAMLLWILWGIHILSAVIVGWLLPGEPANQCVLSKQDNISVTKSLHSAMRNLITVCAWVILFRLFLDFLNKWLIWLFPPEIKILLTGAIELTNGCVMLQQINSEGMKFILVSAMLSFGGFCVAMQTLSVTKRLGIGFYFSGKILQMLLSIALSFLLQSLLFSSDSAVHVPWTFMIPAVFFIIIFVYVLRRKKVVAFRGSMLYNSINKSIERG